MSSYFDGSAWSLPEIVSKEGDNYCNYLDIDFNNQLGALVYTVFVEDPVNGHHEKIKLLPWKSDHFGIDEVTEIYVDSVCHIQLPSVVVQNEGLVAIAVKTEKMIKKNENSK